MGIKTIIRICEVSVTTAVERWEDNPGFQGQQAKLPTTHTFTCSGNVTVTWHSSHVNTSWESCKQSIHHISKLGYTTQANFINLDVYIWPQCSLYSSKEMISQAICLEETENILGQCIALSAFDSLCFCPLDSSLCVKMCVSMHKPVYTSVVVCKRSLRT